jgi:hypothetical protein
MSTTYTRVRTTSCNVAPNRSSAASTFLSAWTAWAYGSPWPPASPEVRRQEWPGGHALFLGRPYLSSWSE